MISDEREFSKAFVFGEPTTACISYGVPSGPNVQFNLTQENVIFLSTLFDADDEINNDILRQVGIRETLMAEAIFYILCVFRKIKLEFWNAMGKYLEFDDSETVESIENQLAEYRYMKYCEMEDYLDEVWDTNEWAEYMIRKTNERGEASDFNFISASIHCEVNEDFKDIKEKLEKGKAETLKEAIDLALM